MSAAQSLNFHHLHYFWAVAKEGNLTRTAAKLRVAQSALSAQIRQLEAQLGEALFVREGRGLALTEAGKVAFDYAEDVFSTGDELVATLKGGRRREHLLRAGAVATLSRNFQESFLAPLLGQPDVQIHLRSGSLDDLLVRLAGHELDLVLSNRRPPRGARHEDGAQDATFKCRRIARQQVSLVGHRRRRSFRFPESLRDQPMIVPGPESDIRTELDALCEQLGIALRVLAEVDDMAMMRLLARDTGAIAVVPSVVVRDELRSGALHEYCEVPDLFETFYAITIERRYPHPLVRSLLSRDEEAILAMER